jgi:hypothetical protein
MLWRVQGRIDDHRTSPARHMHTLKLPFEPSWETTVVRLAYEHTMGAAECELQMVEGDTHPTLIVRGDESNSHTTTAWSTIVRFFGRLSRVYPSTDASHAMLVDSSLMSLALLIEQGEWTGDDLDALEASMAEEEWIHNFTTPTLADICWYAAVRHVLLHESVDAIAWLMHTFADRPALKRWWQAARTAFEYDVVKSEAGELDADTTHQENVSAESKQL